MIWQIFCRKLYENQRFWTERGHPSPLGCATARARDHCILWNYVIFHYDGFFCMGRHWLLFMLDCSLTCLTWFKPYVGTFSINVNGNLVGQWV